MPRRRATACASPSRNPAAWPSRRATLLGRCGLSWRESRDRLFCYGETLPIDLLLVRDDDIPGLIADGVCDLGIVGRNVLREQDAGRADGRHARRRSANGARSASAAAAWRSRCPMTGTGTAPRSWPACASPPVIRRCCRTGWRAQGVDADVVVLSGSVEIAPRLGKADAICDLVSSGATLAANQLKPVRR